MKRTLQCSQYSALLSVEPKLVVGPTLTGILSNAVMIRDVFAVTIGRRQTTSQESTAGSKGPAARTGGELRFSIAAK